MRQLNSRRGLTLVELLVALAIAGLAMLGGVLLLDQVNDSGGRIGEQSTHDATAGNGDRILRRLLADAQSTTDTTRRFRADAHNASYLTMCDAPSGWAEPCRATLSIDSLPDSSAVIAETDRGDRIELRRIAGAASFRYLDLLAPPDSMWVSQWVTSIALPAAIALIAGPDTTILPLGSVRD